MFMRKWWFFCASHGLERCRALLLFVSTFASPKKKDKGCQPTSLQKVRAFLLTASHIPLAYSELAFPYSWLLVSAFSLSPIPPPSSSLSILTLAPFISVHRPISGVFPVTRDLAGLTRPQRPPTWWSSRMGLASISFTAGPFNLLIFQQAWCVWSTDMNPFGSK